MFAIPTRLDDHRNNLLMVLVGCALGPTAGPVMAGWFDVQPSLAIFVVPVGCILLVLSAVVAAVVTRKLSMDDVAALFQICYALGFIVLVGTTVLDIFSWSVWFLMSWTLFFWTLGVMTAVLGLMVYRSVQAWNDVIRLDTRSSVPNGIAVGAVAVFSVCTILYGDKLGISPTQALKFILLLAVAPSCIGEILDGAARLFRSRQSIC